MLLGVSTKGVHSEPDYQQLDRWISGIAEEDRDAFAALYHATKSPVYGFALSILKNAQDAEDVLHDSYVSIYSAAPSYRSSGKPLAWVMTITKNHCMTRLRERKRTGDVPQEDWEGYLSGHAELSVDEKLMLEHCMGRLTDQERQIVVLHAVAGFKHREISEILSIPLPTVLSKYHRATKKLRKLLEGGQKNG